jgi:penicillin-binding protein 2
MNKRIYVFLLFVLLLAGCRQPVTSPPAPSASAKANANLPTPILRTTHMPDPESAAQAFLQAWKAEDYEAMYGLLTAESQASISQDAFHQHFRDIAVEAALSGIDYQITNADDHDLDTAKVSYHVTLHSALVGDVNDDTAMNLRFENGGWRIQWDDTIVLSPLSGGNYLKMVRDAPDRAVIYDRNGQPFMEEADAVSVGLWPDKIDYDKVDELYVSLSRLTGIPVENIQSMVDNALPGDYIPLGEYTEDQMNRRGGGLHKFGSVQIVPFHSRFYFEDGIAPHVVGYVAAMQPDEVDAYRRKGYLKDEMIGQRGLEKWGEGYLLGKPGGTLYVRNGQDQPILKLAEAPAEPAQAITTTIDLDLQVGVQKALQGFNGAAVVLERDTGRVLAIASSPSFDPNAFAPGNYNSYALLSDINNPNEPLYNRATQGQYPLGSVFKVVTMAAALESGLYTPETTYDCGYFFTELAGMKPHDWTYDYYLKDGKTKPSGLLTLPQGLIRSCDPFFWHIGVGLFNSGLTHAVSDMARSFGLGEKTGITGVEELPGKVPDPPTVLDAFNLAIGQGDLQVTPIQVADFMAAVGNGGTLYRPQVIERIGSPNGKPSFVFKPEVRGTLPVKPENLEVIQEAMKGVVNSTTPRGTAYYVFNGLRIPVAGKTGTAESSNPDPHGWFAGFTYAGREDKPDIAIAVVVENTGEGADFAAPIFRRIVELYFYGHPGKLYPWEATYNVKKTPEPTAEETPTPEPATEEPNP